MKRAAAVIGANYGGEGKGVVVDFLCQREKASLVVRFNGGANHQSTVVTPDGYRHISRQMGCGTFLGVPTFLSRFVVVSPAAFHDEFVEFEMLGSGARLCVYSDRDCRVTTPIDIQINRALEDSRGFQRHGSSGTGFGETIERCSNPAYDLRFHHLGSDLEDRLEVIRKEWLPARLAALGLPESAVTYTDEVHENFLSECDHFRNWVLPAELSELDLSMVIFEGAQGLLLDQDCQQSFPHVTRSSTGIKNVKILCAENQFDHLDGYYVSRTYQMRHGHGPIMNPSVGLSYEDNTNGYNAYQGGLRFGHIDATKLYRRCYDDFGVCYKVVFTHCDQLPPPCEAVLYFAGPTRDDFTTYSVKDEIWPGTGT